MPPPALAILGPTASGKTDLALLAAEALNGEIISADSALVYRGLDIGAAKPSAAERAAVPHHLLDVCDPAVPFSAADYARAAADALAQCTQKGCLPIVAGGTFLYVKALLDGLSPMPSADPAVRAAIEREAAERGWPALHAELARVDPARAAELHPNHSQRISRSLEIYRATGRPHSAWLTGGGGGALEQYRWRIVVLLPGDRAALHARIERRFDAMWAAGLEREVQALRARGDLHLGLPALRAVGYRQVWRYLDGDSDYATMRAEAIAATRQLAKRQLTWLRNWHELRSDPRVIWREVDPFDARGEPLATREIFARALNGLELGPI